VGLFASAVNGMLRIMAEPEQSIIREIGFWMTGAAGGVVDYLNQLARGERRWSLAGAAVHVLSALFFGYLVGLGATGLGYSQEVCSALSGLGGYFGVRVADLAMIFLNRRSGD